MLRAPLHTTREGHWPVAQLLGFVMFCGSVGAQTSMATSQQRITVSRFGGGAVSRSITTLWLAGTDRRPVLMVYFQGPDDWYKMPWNIDSKFEKGKCWAELQSENATLRVEIDPGTNEASVQFRRFNLNESNTFLVLHMGELLVPHNIISLGVFDLPPSNDGASPVLLLQAHPELMARITKEVRAGEPGDRSPPHSSNRPCIEGRVDLLNKGASRKGGMADLFPASLPVSKVPCWP